MSKGWEGGSTREDRKARAFVLNRDGHRCQLRLEGCTTIATTAHHTIGKRMTGADPRFMVAACEPCNLKVGDPTKADPDPLPWAGW